VDVIMGVVVGS